jgi:hypothetical protein
MPRKECRKKKPKRFPSPRTPSQNVVVEKKKTKIQPPVLFPQEKEPQPLERLVKAIPDANGCTAPLLPSCTVLPGEKSV